MKKSIYLLMVVAVLVTGCSKAQETDVVLDNKTIEYIASLEKKVNVLEEKLADIEALHNNELNQIESLELKTQQLIDDVAQSPLTEEDSSITSNLETINLLHDITVIKNICYKNAIGKLTDNALRFALTHDSIVDKSTVDRIEVYSIWDGDSCEDVFFWSIDEERWLNLSVHGTSGELIWSPDNSYVLVDSGTDVIRSGELVSILEQRIIAEISYLQKIWTDDSKYLLYNSPNTDYLFDEGAIGDGNTYGIYLLNASTGESTVIDTGYEDYYCIPESISDKEIRYKKVYIDGKEEILTYIYN